MIAVVIKWTISILSFILHGTHHILLASGWRVPPRHPSDLECPRHKSENSLKRNYRKLGKAAALRHLL